MIILAFVAPSSDRLTRQQILLALVLTAMLLGGISLLWIQLGQVQMVPLRWRPDDLLIGGLLGLGIALSSGLLFRLWPLYARAAGDYLHLVVSPLGWLDLIWLGLLPGISEEVLFRGVALGALGLTYGSILLTGVVFGLLHISERRFWAYGLWAGALGILLGASLAWRGNLLLPIVAHVAANTLGSGWWKWRARLN